MHLSLSIFGWGRAVVADAGDAEVARGGGAVDERLGEGEVCDCDRVDGTGVAEADAEGAGSAGEGIAVSSLDVVGILRGRGR